jgi:hypothetical protein
MSKNLFHSEHRILADPCAIGARDKQNNSMNNYSIYNYFKGTTDDCSTFDKNAVLDTSLDTQMHIKKGYGPTDKCVIDDDSKMRNDSLLTHSKDPQQIFGRVFTAVPSLNKGGLVVPVEDRVKQGEFKRLAKGCDNLSERQFAFMPMIPCLAHSMQNADFVIPPFENGAPTRSYIHQTKFLENNGYFKTEQGIWKRRVCAFADR